MKFTITLTDVKPSEWVGVWEVSYKLESELVNFSGIEYFGGALPETMLQLNEETAERVRDKMMKAINELPQP